MVGRYPSNPNHNVVEPGPKHRLPQPVGPLPKVSLAPHYQLSVGVRWRAESLETAMI